MNFQVMGLVSWVVMGLLAGIVAKFLMPGKDGGGCILTSILGIIGAVLGGFIATQLGFGGVSGFDFRSLAIATAGAVILLLVLRIVRPKQ